MGRRDGRMERKQGIRRGYGRTGLEDEMGRRGGGGEDGKKRWEDRDSILWNEKRGLEERMEGDSTNVLRAI